MRSARPLLLAPALALLWGAGCKDEPSPDNDRTLARLKEEADREAGKGQPPQKGPPHPQGPVSAQQMDQAVNDTLAKIAAESKKEPADRAGQQVALPAENATVRLGPWAVKLLTMSASHTESGGKLTLSTEDLFLRAQLVTQNMGSKPAKLDLAFARVVDSKGGEHPLARDVQRLAGTKELSVELPAGERREFILYFEVPGEGPGKGWSLTLPAAAGGEQDVSIPLG